MWPTACAPSSSTGTPAACAVRDDRRDRVHRAHRVGDVLQRHQPRALAQQACEGLQIEPRVVGDRDRHDFRAGGLGRELPRHDVRVVRHAGDEDLVARAQAAPGEGRGHQVDALGGAAGPDHLLARGRVDEAAHRVARALEGAGGTIAQRVRAAVHVGIDLAVVGRDRLDHRHRLLRGRGVVEVDQRLAVDLLREDRELGAQAPGIEGRNGGCTGRRHEGSPCSTSARPNQPVSTARSATPSGSIGMSLTSSLMKPKPSSTSASRRPMPRVSR